MSLDWAEKYRPLSLADVVGNPEATNSLREWAESWDRGVPKKRAVILVGDPGVGKTSCALALANEFGWGTVEMNASDLRNADAIKRIAASGALNETFTDSGEYISSQTGGRKLVILDEADNIFGKQDYGGVAAITATIRETRQPIVLIVNDLYALTRRSPPLKNLCHIIRFSAIKKPSVVRVLRSICSEEDVGISNETLHAIAEHSGGDLRSAINDLESLALGKRRISEKDVMILGHRDSRISIFKALAGIFKATSYSKARESLKDLDEDPEHILLWIDENIPFEYKRPGDLASAYMALSAASINLGRVRRRQHYRFWGYASDLMSAGIALSKTQVNRGFTRYQFPSWLSNMSRTKGLRSTQRSLNIKLSRHCHTSSNVSQTALYPYFKYLFENDREFRVGLVRTLDMDAEEIGFVLDEKDDSQAVKLLLEEIRKKDEPKHKERPSPDEPEEEGWEEAKKEKEKKKKTAAEEEKEGEKGRAQKMLGDF